MNYMNFLETFKICLIVFIVFCVYVIIEQYFVKQAAIKRRKKYFDEYERKNKKH